MATPPNTHDQAAIAPVTPLNPPPAAQMAAQMAVKPAPKRRVLIIAGVILLVAVAAGGRIWWRSNHLVETDNAYLTGHVHPVSARVAGVVTKVLVDDNQVVHSGDVLAELDPTDQQLRIEQIQAQIVSVQQQVLQADAQIAQAKAQASTAVAQLAQADAQALKARQDADRYSQLYNAQMKAVSKAEVDAVNAGLTGAQADVAAKRSSVGAANAQASAVATAHEVARAQVKVLETQLKDAQQQMAYNRIVAPVSGRVGKRSLEVGARVQAGQQLLALVEDQVWVTANFKETQLHGLQTGQRADIRVDALPDHVLHGRVDSIAPASGAQFALLPADNATGNFTKIVQRIPVKILLAADDLRSFHDRLAPGMSVVVEVELDQPGQPQKTAAASKPEAAVAAR
ncbi:HlyD family secretion protein [Undibacterium sp.]|uniref:HlyD family secretion protein n=1 Tax=Undibacterium sp. TaxID=1914977 RepID=UPI00374CFF9C